MIYFLTSSPSLYMDGALNPANHFIDNLRRALPGRIHGVFIPTHPDDVGFSEHCSDCMRAAFEEAGIHFKTYTLLDRRNAPFAESIIGGSNFVILGGGHVPTQNAFLHDIHLPQLIKYFGGVVLGISAGSMNCARIVYAQPEEEGEARDPEFRRFLPGLGLTEVQILPHYYMCRDMKVDGLKVYDEIACPDSLRTGSRFYVFPDGTYLYGHNGNETVYGEFYLIENGNLRPVATEGQCVGLPFV